MATLARDGVDLHYEVSGAGDPLLLVAGLAFDSTSWQPIAGTLASRFRVIAIDNRGAGRTTPLDAPTSIAAMADDCAALISHLGLPSAHVLGHSMGGFIAQELTLRHPGLVRKLVLAATGPVNPRRNNALFADWAAAFERGADPAEWFRNIYYWTFSARFFDDPAAVDAAVRFAVGYPYPQTPRAFRNQVDAIAAFDRTRDAGGFRARTLVLSGAEDLLFPAADGAAFATALPDARYDAIPRAGHSLHLEFAPAFAERVLAFLAAD